MIKVITIKGTNYHNKTSKTRIACRGIVVKNHNILLSYEQMNNQIFIPGGGVENNEDLVTCCKREIMEETGYICNIKDEYLTIIEYYEEYEYINHYFICELTNKNCEPSLTIREKEVGLIPIWLDIDKAVEIFSTYKLYENIHNDESLEMKHGAYLREYTALSIYINKMNKESVYEY